MSQLAAEPFDWDIIRYASVPVRRLKVGADSLDTPARSAALGFWYLHENQPHLAVEAFSHVQDLPHGREMQQLASCLALALSAKNLNDNDLVNSLSIPNAPLLRADTWPTISRFRSIVDDAQIIYHSYSRSAQSLALNRALGTLTEILNKASLIPQAERNLIVTIAESWREKLLAIATDVGEVTHTQPVQNPYVAGDPVEGDLFVGRGEVIKQLEELWLTNGQLQSVVLYGHRRMGKTSILKNLPNYLGNNIQVIYINLLNLGAVSEGAGEVLITLSDAISQKLSIRPPDDETLLRLPEVTFRRFIQTINQKLKNKQGLIIALDEFEKIEELILAGKLYPNFLGFLRGLLQEHPRIAFAFAGLHTLEEMTEDYFNPLFASVLPIRIGFFTLSETRELLANPAEDFTLDYAPATLNEIYQLTAGQPYLTQLIGFQLVRHYNHQVFEAGRDRSSIFTPEDLTTVIHHSDFFTKGRYYFTGVWNQAEQDTPHQQAILKILAQQAAGYSVSDIRRQSRLSEAEVIEALKTLQRHDVVCSSEGKWTIIVPLFLQWVSHQ
ncbi:MAG: ATP-binding protein [Phormidesmis sp.]